MKRYTLTVRRGKAKFSESFEFSCVEDYDKFLAKIAHDPGYEVTVINNHSNELVFGKRAGETEPWFDRFSAGAGEWRVRIWVKSALSGGWAVETEETMDSEEACKAYGCWVLENYPMTHILERRYEVIQALPF